MVLALSAESANTLYHSAQGLLSRYRACCRWARPKLHPSGRTINYADLGQLSFFGGSATRILRQGPEEQNRLRAREKKVETSGPDVENELPREREVFELGSRGR